MKNKTDDMNYEQGYLDELQDFKDWAGPICGTVQYNHRAGSIEGLVDEFIDTQEDNA